jgi:aspartyl-tRNA(Asn)/glutamyl-tRNA(Gln) amidotransferase subunit A
VTISNETRFGYDLTIAEARDALEQSRLTESSSDLTSFALTNQFLDRIERFQPVLHAFVDVLADQARADAKASDDGRITGIERGRLRGIPFAIKDIIDVAGVPTKCGSLARETVDAATDDAPVVTKLRQAGAVILGKTTTQEFAAGVVSPPARNPWDPTRIPGGSSGGSAAAVVAGLATAAIGTDTGGSIRIPAAVCGAVGLKPTYGAVSKRGVFPLAASLDTVGPITRTVRDAASVFDVIAGYDPLDPDSATIEHKSAATTGSDLKGVRIGVPRPFFFNRLQPFVAKAINDALDLARELGAEVIETTWADAPIARATGMVINRIETVDVHADGIRTHPELYGQELRERVQATMLFPRSEYLRAQRAREYVKRSIARLYAEHRLDVLLTPTMPATAVPADDLFARYPDGSSEPVTLAYTRLTSPFNATGQPALTIPVALDPDGLPVGAQLVGKPFGEADLCRIGCALEGAIDWRNQHSPMRMPRFGAPDAEELPRNGDL